MTIPDKSPRQLAKDIEDKLYSILPYQEQEAKEIMVLRDTLILIGTKL
jgi:hypothetical protein